MNYLLLLYHTSFTLIKNKLWHHKNGVRVLSRVRASYDYEKLFCAIAYVLYVSDFFFLMTIYMGEIVTFLLMLLKDI